MAQNLEINRVIRRLEAGDTTSLQGITDVNVKKALRAYILGVRPVSRTGDPEVDKMMRKLLNRR